ncbi:SpoIIE family protein phosphatase [uncultured Treponema sp.]|uniref:PP2C family protein-serine/threonine phosphatase n=1 Tax=uncultured Treponema sp. TaxID=162155 RepID=UPI0025DBAC6C|nr:SpoIIE family protein phosphatase [uncultured Treponema sp.]
MKKKFFSVLAFLAFALFLFSACSSVGSERIRLDTGWTYSLYDPEFDNSGFKELDDEMLSQLERLLPESQGYIWLKKTFELPQSLKGKLLGCYLGRITIADETFLNGTMIGGEGLFPPHEFSAWNRSRLYSIPEKLISDGENTLLVKIWVDGEGSIVSNPFIGEINDATMASKRVAFWASRIQLVFAFFMLGIGIYHLILYAKSRTEKDNFAFGLINVISSIYLFVFYNVEIPSFTGENISFLWFQKIFSSGLPYLLPFLVTMYINSFLKRNDRKPIFIARVVFAVVPVFIVLCCPSYRVLRQMQPLLQAMLIPPMLYIIIILVGKVVQKQRDSLTLLIGFSPLVLAVVLDFLIHSVLNLYDFPYISSIGWQLVILTLLFIMANRFANSKLEVEYLNKNLEKEVADRTKELSESNEQLSLTNEELFTAKRRADRDMQLAVYVQRSFYQSSLPEFEDWDIAWHFTPMAGVSGDLYDFFVHKNVLNGVGLFDVSGHGIASGLVTMLAKTVIDRKFHDGLNEPLANVMSEINKQIGEEKGDIENYLTGVMLRLKGNKVEYLSAGHPKAFFRSGSSGKTVPIEVDGKSGSGGLIGIPMLEPEYSAIGFSVKSGDSILLYTDCLSESRNKNGEEYGYEGITKAFAKADGNAHQKLDSLLEDFKAFTDGVPANDDLTVIVLQKK